MLIDRAQALAKEKGYKLVHDMGYDWNLYDPRGQWVDTLHQFQIGELLEEDYIEFYLGD